MYVVLPSFEGHSFYGMGFDIIYNPHSFLWVISGVFFFLNYPKIDMVCVKPGNVSFHIKRKCFHQNMYMCIHFQRHTCNILFLTYILWRRNSIFVITKSHFGLCGSADGCLSGLQRRHCASLSSPYGHQLLPHSMIGQFLRQAGSIQKNCKPERGKHSMK